jgi:AmmeMemoRadiSam system protein B
LYARRTIIAATHGISQDRWVSNKRPPAVAGSFYPADADELRRQLEGFLATAREGTAAGDVGVPRALIGPHAGTVYSGPVAASGYVRVARGRGMLRRVLLLGPAHRVAFDGLAASTAEAFVTPLGEVGVDQAATSALCATLPQVRPLDEAHRREHSLELHLVFLQLVLDDFALLPLAVGDASAEEVAEVIEHVWDGPDVLVVASTDLSHFHDYATARRIDGETTAMIERLDHEAIDGRRACGAGPVRGLLLAARRRGYAVETLDVRSSGDTAGPRSEVVGYGSYVIA